MENNRHIRQIKDYFLKAVEALENNYIEDYERYVQEADKIFQLYREDCKLTYECTNFGMANHIFEDALPLLFKNNNQVVKKFIKTIKEDKNLLTQFKLYKALSKINETTDKRQYVNEALELAKNDISVKNLQESNEKLFTIIKENNIRPSEIISENDLSLYASCDYLLKNPRKLSNLNKINENIDVLLSYQYKQNNFNTKQENVFEAINAFEAKYASILSEEEKNIVKTLTEGKSDNGTMKKEELYNKYKNECLDTIKALCETAVEEEKEGLYAIKEQIANQMFCEETLIKDLAKLLEIKDILNN